MNEMPTNNAREMFRKVIPGNQPQTDDGTVLRLIERARVTPIVTVDPESDEEFRSLVAHCLRPSEKLCEFTARTGLGKGTILAQRMTSEEISRFVERSELNAAQDPNAPSQPNWQVRKVPAHFEI